MVGVCNLIHLIWQPYCEIEYTNDNGNGDRYERDVGEELSVNPVGDGEVIADSDHLCVFVYDVVSMVVFVDLVILLEMV